MDQQFGYVRYCLTLQGSVLSFSATITAQFCFIYTLEGVTAMPRGQHASLCHAFRVIIIIVIIICYRCCGFITSITSTTSQWFSC